MLAIWAFITTHWIISTVVGVPLLVMILRGLFTSAEISSTIKRLYPDGLPAAQHGQPVRDPKFSGKHLKLREMKFYGTYARKILGIAVDKPIVIRRGEPKEGRAYGQFHIYLGYSPRGEKCLEAPKEVFGQERVWDGEVYAFTGIGTPILDGNGNIVAEYQEESIYFLVDPNLYGIFGGARVFAEVMAQVTDIIHSAAASGTAEHFVTELDKAVERSLAQKAPRAKQIQGSEEREEPTAAWQRLSEESRVAELESVHMRSQATHELGKEYDLLCQVRKVRSVSVTDKYIELDTETLYCTDPAKGDVYEMGRFRIRIPLKSGESVRWKNLTRQVNGYAEKMMSLHVYENGKACLGNTAPWFKKLIAERQFADAAKLAIAFVETVNPEDTRTYKYIHKWPKVRGGAA